jgi:hypothetical protein
LQVSKLLIDDRGNIQKYNQKAVLAKIPAKVRYFHSSAYARCLSGEILKLVNSEAVGAVGRIWRASSLASIYKSMNLLASSWFFN